MYHSVNDLIGFGSVHRMKNEVDVWVWSSHVDFGPRRNLIRRHKSFSPLLTMRLEIYDGSQLSKRGLQRHFFPVTKTGRTVVFRYARQTRVIE